jgi:ribosomal protein S3AE
VVKLEKHRMLNIHKLVEFILNLMLNNFISIKIKAIRKKMVEIMTRDIAGSELKEVVNKLYVIFVL